MAQLQDLVLLDRAATPVSHTYTPAGFRDNGVVAVVEEAVGGTPAASRTFTISHRRQGGKMKTRLVHTIPVVQTETINGISKPKVVRVAVIDQTFTFSLDSTEQERNDAVGLTVSALSATKPLVHDTLVGGRYVY